jgi:hypothetical protein
LTSLIVTFSLLVTKFLAFHCMSHELRPICLDAFVSAQHLSRKSLSILFSHSRCLLSSVKIIWSTGCVNTTGSCIRLKTNTLKEVKNFSRRVHSRKKNIMNWNFHWYVIRMKI